MAWCSGRTPNDRQTGQSAPIHKKGDRRECTNNRGISAQPHWKSVGRVPRKNIPRNNWIKAEWYPVRFSSWSEHYRPNFRKILVLCQRRLHMFCRPWESIRPFRIPPEKLCGVLLEYGVNGCPLLSVKLLCLPAHKFSCVSMELNYNHSPWVLEDCVLFLVALRPTWKQLACAAQICVNVARWRLHTTSCMIAPNSNLRATSMRWTTLPSYKALWYQSSDQRVLTCYAYEKSVCFLWKISSFTIFSRGPFNCKWKLR